MIYWFYLILAIGACAVVFFGPETDRDFKVLVTLGFCSVLMGLSLLMFHNLSVEITEEELRIKFGVGWISRKYKLKEIDPASISIEPIAFWKGVGLRYDFDGNEIFSVQFGKGLRLKPRPGISCILIGFDDVENLKTALVKAVQDKRDRMNP
jgi:hypothetical protein